MPAVAAAPMEGVGNPDDPAGKPYEPRGNLRRFWPEKAKEIVVSGPAGTGKSRAILERIYALCLKYAELRVLICRKTRASMTQSTLVTFERDVVPGRPKWINNQKRNVRTSYILPNGSEIVISGLDNPDRILSTDYDLIYIQESREIVEGDWETLTSRLRSTVMPWRPIWGDTNPDGPAHWILERERRGSLTLIPTTHEDNPLLYNEATGEWTEFGNEYIATLDNMTGLRKARLRWGKWVGGENVVYEDWDPAVHVVAPFAVPSNWKLDLTVDFGFTHAFCALWSAEDPDGRIYFYRELYGTQRTTIDWAHMICEYGGPDNARLRAVITDHDRGERLDLEKHMGHRADECPDQAADKKGREWEPVIVGTTPAIKGLEMRGIQAVQNRLRRAGDGFPRLFLCKGMRVNMRDDRLVEAKAPTCTEEEFPNYQWAKARSLTAGEVLLERPVDRWNDGLDACFVAGTLVETERGPVPIEQVTTADRVLTRAGYCAVLDAGMTLVDAEVMTVDLSNGTSLTGTGNHPIWVNNSWSRMDSLRYRDIIQVCELRRSSTRASSSAATQRRRVHRRGSTSILASRSVRLGLRACIERYTRMSTAQSLTAAMSTISTSITTTTIPRTSSRSRRRFIRMSTIDRAAISRTDGVSISLESARLRLRGTAPTLDERGIVSTGKMSGWVATRSSVAASSVARTSTPSLAGRAIGSARTTASHRGVEPAASITRRGSVLDAARTSLSTVTGRIASALVAVVHVRGERLRQPVYNLTVEGQPEYFANGILVHNCRYRVMHSDADLFPIHKMYGQAMPEVIKAS